MEQDTVQKNTDIQMRQERYRSLLMQTAEYAISYINTAGEMPAFPNEKELLALQEFAEALPQNGTKASEVIEKLYHVGAPGTTAQIGGRYFGFVNGGLLPVAHAAEWLVDTWNQNGALAIMSPVTAKLEELCEQWIVELLGLEPGTAMGLVTGSSNAALCALAAARNSLLQGLGYDIMRNGLRNAPPLRVLVSEDAHASVKAALSVLGFGFEEVELLPTDEYGRIRTEAIPEMDSRTLCVVQAGNVNGGSYDPIDEICDKARKAGAWVHVDGAFGLWAAASRKYRYLVKGMEKADSWSVDAHKTLNAGYDCGIVLCRHRDALVSALQASGSYIQYREHRDGMLYTTEMSRRARAIPLWAVLKSLGSDGVEHLIDTLCERAEYFAGRLKDIGFNVINPVFFNQFMAACEIDAKTEAVLRTIQNSGVCWCSGSKWKGRSIIRVSVCSHATMQEDIDKSVIVFRKALHGEV